MVSHDSTCFIIMPFSDTLSHNADYWTNHYENFLLPFIKGVLPDYEVRKSKPKRESILDNIIVDVIRSRIVVADITDFNPNVIWELGIRHSFSYGTIIIAEKGIDLKFDFNDMGVLFYDFSQHPYNSKMKEFFDAFGKALKECCGDKIKSDSPVLHASPRGTFYEIITRNESIRKLNGLLMECDHNLEVENGILARAKKNQKLRKKKSEAEKSMSTTNQRWAALEFLSVNQYLDQPETLYNEVNVYLRFIMADCDALKRWLDNPELHEKWLISNVPRTIKKINKFKSKIEAIKKELEQEL